MINIEAITIRIQGRNGIIEPIYEVHTFEESREVLEKTLSQLDNDEKAKVTWSVTGTIAG
jgi:hypothetical protein